MFCLLLALLSFSPARAETPHLPPEVKEKVQEAKAAVSEGYRLARQKLGQAEKDSQIVESITHSAARLWAGAKAKGRGALVYLDRQLHEKVLGPESLHK